MLEIGTHDIHNCKPSTEKTEGTLVLPSGRVFAQHEKVLNPILRMGQRWILWCFLVWLGMSGHSHSCVTTMKLQWPLSTLPSSQPQQLICLYKLSTLDISHKGNQRAWPLFCLTSSTQHTIKTVHTVEYKYSTPLFRYAILHSPGDRGLAAYTFWPLRIRLLQILVYVIYTNLVFSLKKKNCFSI